MMGIVVPETYWAYKKYNKTISGIYLVFILQPAEALNSGKSRKCPPTGKPIAFEIIFDNV